MAVLLDGSVPPCKHALVAADGRPGYPQIMGNVFTDGLDAAWNGMEAGTRIMWLDDIPAL